jgi:hypothetical protein
MLMSNVVITEVTKSGRVSLRLPHKAYRMIQFTTEGHLSLEMECL